MKKIVIALLFLLSTPMLHSLASAADKCPRNKPYYICDKTGCRCADAVPGTAK